MTRGAADDSLAPPIAAVNHFWFRWACSNARPAYTERPKLASVPVASAVTARSTRPEIDIGDGDRRMMNAGRSR